MKNKNLIIGAAAAAILLPLLIKKGLKFELVGIEPNPSGGGNNVVKYTFEGKLQGHFIQGDFWMTLDNNNQPYSTYSDALILTTLHPKLGELKAYVTSIENEQGESILLFDVVQTSTQKAIYQKQFNLTKDVQKLNQQ